MDSRISHLIPKVMKIGSVTSILTATVLIKTLIVRPIAFIQCSPYFLPQLLTLSAPPPTLSSHFLSRVFFFSSFCYLLFHPHHTLNIGVSQRQIFFFFLDFHLVT